MTNMASFARLNDWNYLIQDQQHHLQYVLRSINLFQFDGQEKVRKTIEQVEVALKKLLDHREAVNYDQDKIGNYEYLQLMADTFELNTAIDDLLTNGILMPMLERQANSLIGVMSNIRWFVKLRREQLVSPSINLWPPTFDSNHPPLLPANEVERRVGFIFKMLNDVVSHCTNVRAIQEKDSAIEASRLLTLAVRMYFQGQFSEAEAKLTETLLALKQLKSVDETLDKKVARSLAPRMIHQTEKLNIAIILRSNVVKPANLEPPVLINHQGITEDMIMYHTEPHVTQQNEFTKDSNFLTDQVYDLKVLAARFCSYEKNEYTADLQKVSQDVNAMSTVLFKLIADFINDMGIVGKAEYRSPLYKIIYHLTDAIELASKSINLPIIRRLQIETYATLSNIQWFDHCSRPTQIPTTSHLLSPQIECQPKAPAMTPVERSIEMLLQLAHSISVISEMRLLMDANRFASRATLFLIEYDNHYARRQLPALKMTFKILKLLLVPGELPSQVECDPLMSLWYERMCSRLETMQQQCDAEFALIEQ